MVMANREHSASHRLPAVPAHERTIYEIRTLDGAAELIESYRLRYEVYSTLGYIRRFNKSKLEIDGYDSRSIPFGAFDPASGTMIGTLRVITAELQPEHERSIRRALAGIADEELTRQALAPPPYPLPSITSNEIDRQIKAFNTDRFLVHEMSRTIVRPGHRGMGVSRGLVELGFAYASRSGPVVVIGGCVPAHLSLYARFGCRKLPNTGVTLSENVGQLGNTVIGRTDVLPQPTQGHVEELLRSMEAGATECTLELGHESYAVYRFAPSCRARRRTTQR